MEQDLELHKIKEIKAPKHEVWKTLTDPAQIRKWMKARIFTQGKVGDKIIFRFETEGKPVIDNGSIKAIRKEELLEIYFLNTHYSLLNLQENYSTISLKLEAVDKYSYLEISQKNFPSPLMITHASKVWDQYLDNIKNITEFIHFKKGGGTGDTRKTYSRKD